MISRFLKSNYYRGINVKLESKNIVNKYSISKNKIEIIVAIVEGYVRKIGKNR